MRLRISQLLVPCILLAISACSRAPLHGTPERAKQISEVRDALHLEYPYRVTAWGYQTDGGTLGFSIQDRWWKTQKFALDGRIDLTSGERASAALAAGVDTIRVPTRHFFMGATNRMEKGAVELPLLGRQESAILSMLTLVATDHFPSSLIDSLADNCAVEKWIAAQEGLSEERKVAMRAGALARTRQSVDPRGSIVVLK